MNFAEIKELHQKFLTPNYTRLPVAVDHAEGSIFFDVEGKRYIDLFPGWAVSSLGYCHPRVVEAIREQAGRLLHVPNTFHVPNQAVLAQRIVEKSFPGKVFFCNSGAEAVESALKLARLHGRARRYKIVSCDNSFHGRTFGALSATGQEKYQRDFRPLVPGFRSVPFNDLAAVSEAIDEETIAVIVEPVQGEGGINVAEKDYLVGLRRLTAEKDVVLIFDEVQTGFGRAGAWFAFQRFGVQPDIMCLAKALGGGVPVGAIVSSNHLADLLVPGTHASTFGGSALVCAASLAVIDVLEQEGLIQRSLEMEPVLRDHFLGWQDRFKAVKTVRGLGMMWGVELSQDGKPVVDACLQRGVNINCTHGSVLRFLPALNVQQDILEEGLNVVESVFKETFAE